MVDTEVAEVEEGAEVMREVETEGQRNFRKADVSDVDTEVTLEGIVLKRAIEEEDLLTEVTTETETTDVVATETIVTITDGTKTLAVVPQEDHLIVKLSTSRLAEEITLTLQEETWPIRHMQVANPSEAQAEAAVQTELHHAP